MLENWTYIEIAETIWNSETITKIASGAGLGPDLLRSLQSWQDQKVWHSNRKKSRSFKEYEAKTLALKYARRLDEKASTKGKGPLYKQTVLTSSSRFTTKRTKSTLQQHLQARFDDGDASVNHCDRCQTYFVSRHQRCLGADRVVLPKPRETLIQVESSSSDYSDIPDPPMHRLSVSSTDSSSSAMAWEWWEPPSNPEDPEIPSVIIDMPTYIAPTLELSNDDDEDMISAKQQSFDTATKLFHCRENLFKMAKALKWTLFNVSAKGNCFFHAALLSLQKADHPDIPKNHFELRQRVGEWLDKHIRTAKRMSEAAPIPMVEDVFPPSDPYSLRKGQNDAEERINCYLKLLKSNGFFANDVILTAFVYEFRVKLELLTCQEFQPQEWTPNMVVPERFVPPRASKLPMIHIALDVLNRHYYYAAVETLRY